ncbi:MAG TPA: beta-ketoacyl synthase chain length factor, partial [Burkholderiaceae bacterium]|nr:beta-ketoacyl synthase chain length factor [Burkholderiaceae bacterium]
LIGWAQAKATLRGETDFVWQDVPAIAPTILPAAERRRCIATARLALNTAQEALQTSRNASERQLACIFSSSDGDSQVITQIMEGLLQEPPEVSPTRFANSVHNAAAGYWSIATGMKLGSSCLSAFDESFAAGLLEAAAQVADEGIDGLYTASDVRFQEPFYALRPIELDCASTLLMTRERSDHSLASIQISLIPRSPASTQPDWLPISFSSNPAARALPLLTALAAPSGQTIYLDYLDQTLAVEVSPC